MHGEFFFDKVVCKRGERGILLYWVPFMETRSLKGTKLELREVHVVM